MHVLRLLKERGPDIYTASGEDVSMTTLLEIRKQTDRGLCYSGSKRPSVDFESVAPV